MAYSAHRVKRQFGLDQDIPGDLTLVFDFVTSLHPHAFDYWSKHFSVVTVPSLQ